MRLRPAPLVAAGLAALALLTSCSSSSIEQAAPAPTTDGAYPVTIDHKFGSTTIAAPPQRVVSLGYTEQDAILAFGVVPVGVRYAFGPQDDVFFPWVDTAAGSATPTILPREEVDPEAVAALRPDLIMAVTAGLDQNQYEVLSRIAPVVVPPKEYLDFGVPWQDQTRIAGRALGQSGRAEELVAQVEAKFAEVKAANPGLIGKSLALSGPSYDGRYPIHASADTRTRFFGELGMVVPPALDAIAGDQFYGYLSREQAGMLNEDVVVFQSGSQQEKSSIEADPILKVVPAIAQGRSIFIEGADYDALQFASVLSLPYLLDSFVPKLTAVAKA
ncbi:iron-siderophore ABC transporter substrate-binding protein [Pseudonocardia alaniniphila]|uniref:Iron-siderophore ABC transporter substrate-binding protein n=1 Tax=Pseudonocardia alaniniphila TaxID=75291 RepID=A0ABS9TDB8_9PSEU|nr:iron-siderophore ABC transporter substrate-binding protein [Pseudonocardia alaniniphila]MCH6166530.1 iron-siderophore ABC transporter substrate-binding protein [Pseudonocardia alaniniphila]